MREFLILEIFNKDKTKKVSIIRRFDGNYTYRIQEFLEGKWGMPSVDVGVYDSPETAESEARQCEPWLRELFH